MSDLVKRLCLYKPSGKTINDQRQFQRDCAEAADEIERLTSELAEAREAFSIGNRAMEKAVALAGERADALAAYDKSRER